MGIKGTARFLKKRIEFCRIFVYYYDMDTNKKLQGKHINEKAVEIAKLEEEDKMPYITSWERIAKKEGKKEGKREGMREAARRMLHDGVSFEDIIKYTGLTEKDIKSLLN